MNLWWIMLAGGLLTFGTRLSFILLLDRISPPPWLYRGLRFVPTAVLTAIVIPELLTHSGSLDVSISNDRLLAGLVAAGVAWRTRSALLTILVGMLVLLALQALGG
jgi:branched-subunit amino acid transport protein